VCVEGGGGRGGVHGKKSKGAFLGEAEQKCEGRKRDGVRETGCKRKRTCEREREREREVVLGGGGCWSVEMSVAH